MNGIGKKILWPFALLLSIGATIISAKKTYLAFKNDFKGVKDKATKIIEDFSKEE